MNFLRDWLAPLIKHSGLTREEIFDTKYVGSDIAYVVKKFRSPYLVVQEGRSLPGQYSKMLRPGDFLFIREDDRYGVADLQSHYPDEEYYYRANREEWQKIKPKLLFHEDLELRKGRRKIDLDNNIKHLESQGLSFELAARIVYHYAGFTFPANLKDKIKT